MNAAALESDPDRMTPDELRLELARTELALERAQASSNAPWARHVIEALQAERERLRERLRGTPGR